MKIPDFRHYTIYEWKSAEVSSDEFKGKRSQDASEPLRLAIPFQTAHPMLPPMKTEHTGLTHPVGEKLNQGFIPQLRLIDPEFLHALRQFTNGRALLDYIAHRKSEERYEQQIADEKFVQAEKEDQKHRINITHEHHFEDQRVNQHKRVDALDRVRDEMHQQAETLIKDTDASKSLFWSMRNMAKQFGEFLIASRLGQVAAPPSGTATTSIRGRQAPNPIEDARNARSRAKIDSEIKKDPAMVEGNRQLAQLVGFSAYRADRVKDDNLNAPVMRDTDALAKVGEAMMETAVKPADAAAGNKAKKIS